MIPWLALAHPGLAAGRSPRPLGEVEALAAAAVADGLLADGRITSVMNPECTSRGAAGNSIPRSISY